MKVYKVNKKSMIGSTLLFVFLATLWIVPIFVGNEYFSGLMTGALCMFAFLHLTGISSLNREHLPIEKIEISDPTINKGGTDDKQWPGKDFPGPSYQTEGWRKG